MDLELFIGRFHPLIVHFPIALLVVAAIIEVVSSRFQRLKQLSLALPFILILGTATALISVIMGWLIANDRGYDDDILFWHRWSGVTILLFSIFLTLVVFKVIRISSTIQTSLFIVLFLLISVAGHLGGSLTHGENYLFERAPAFLRSMFIEEKPESIFSGLPENPDSVVVFKDMIAPLLIAKCTPCHNDTQKKGNLIVTSREGIEAGGDGGPAIRAGKAMESELFRRISLPPEHEKFMPLKETPLSFAEISLIAWWINQGASFEAPLSEYSITEIKHLLIRDFGFNPTKRPYFETVEVLVADSSQVDKLRRAGFLISPLAQDNHFLSVSVSSQLRVVSPELLKELLAIKENVTWLDLGDRQIVDDHLLIIRQLTSLTRLNLNNNPVTDKNLSALADLKYLESLNLFSTEVGDAGLKSLNELPSLNRVYLWNSNATSLGIEELKRLRPKLEVETGAPVVTVPE
jgi:uncharacterized membrane protein